MTDNIRLLLKWDGEVFAVRAIDNAAADLIWPEDLQYDTLIWYRGTPPPSSGALVVVLENSNDRHTYRYPYYLTTPPTIDEKVMLV